MLSRKISDNPKSLTNSRSSKPAHNNPPQTSQPKAAERPNLGRHAAICRICAHPRRQEIEEDFGRPAQIAKDYGLADRSSVYRHVLALNLFPRRRRNVRAALERIIEFREPTDCSARQGRHTGIRLAKRSGKCKMYARKCRQSARPRHLRDAPLTIGLPFCPGHRRFCTAVGIDVPRGLTWMRCNFNAAQPYRRSSMANAREA